MGNPRRGTTIWAGLDSSTEVRHTNVSNPYGEITHEIKVNPWKLGIIYLDPADHRLVVRQRICIGWTLNFGRPLAWAILAAIVGVGILRRRFRER